MSKQDRGFASMPADQQRVIASQGGKAAHAKGRAHQWTREEAAAAGAKGGRASHRAKQAQAESPSDVAERLDATAKA